jgi:hypothetical protein
MAAFMTIGVALGNESSTATNSQIDRAVTQGELKTAVPAVRSGQYVGRPGDSHPGSLTAGFLAFGPGAVFHGLGHFHLGQEERGLALLASEVTGLGLVVFSDQLRRNDDLQHKTARLQDVMAQSGWALFFGSWFADVIGASRGTRPFDPIEAGINTSNLEIGYGYLNTSRRQNQHLVELAMSTRRSMFAFEAEHSQSTQTGSWLSRVDADLQLSDPTLGFVGVGMRIGHSSRYEEQWSFLNYTPMLKWSLDLGLLMSSLRNASFLGYLGYGESGYIFDQTGLNTIWRQKVLWVPRFAFKTGLRFSLNPKFVTELALIHDDAQWIGPRVFQPTRSIAPRALLVQGRLTYRYRDVNLNLELLSGNGQQMSLGLEYGL